MKAPLEFYDLNTLATMHGPFHGVSRAQCHNRAKTLGITFSKLPVGRLPGLWSDQYEALMLKLRNEQPPEPKRIRRRRRRLVG